VSQPTDWVPSREGVWSSRVVLAAVALMARPHLRCRTRRERAWVEEVSTDTDLLMTWVYGGKSATEPRGKGDVLLTDGDGHPSSRCRWRGSIGVTGWRSAGYVYQAGELSRRDRCQVLRCMCISSLRLRRAA
jgi:hypothetical protein